MYCVKRGMYGSPGNAQGKKTTIVGLTNRPAVAKERRQTLSPRRDGTEPYNALRH